MKKKNGDEVILSILQFSSYDFTRMRRAKAEKDKITHIAVFSFWSVAHLSEICNTASYLFTTILENLKESIWFLICLNSIVIVELPTYKCCVPFTQRFV